MKLQSENVFKQDSIFSLIRTIFKWKKLVKQGGCMVNNRISYKEFESYPEFENREEAAKWLEEKYGEDFFFSREGKLDNEPYYIYN